MTLLRVSSVLVICVVLGLGCPKYEAKADDVRLIVINTIAANYLLIFLELEPCRLSLNKRPFNCYKRIVVFIHQLDRLYEFIIASHLNILDLVICSQFNLAVEWMELSEFRRKGAVRHD